MIYRFICSDTGRGMSKEFQQHAFEPFAQEENDARTSYMGTGLGLTITKQLTELMGGSIEVKSELNVGATFTIILPFELDRSREKEIRIIENFPKESLTGKKVLLAEDNELNMEIARFMLENYGMQVAAARNGAEAVGIFEASAEGDFDIILMDVMMPVMDGLTATREIRALERADAFSIPIFAMTANAFVEDRELSRQAGMNEHLSKPLDEKTLIRTIAKYII